MHTPLQGAAGNEKLHHPDVSFQSTSDNSYQDDDQGVSNSEMLRRYVATTPPKPYDGHKTFETPIIWDFDLLQPGKKEFKDVNKPLKMKEADQPTFIDGSKCDELTTKLMGIKPDPVNLRGRKRKAVTFDHHLPLNQKDVATAAASPGKYRTRGAARVEMASNINMGISIPVVTSRAKSPLGKASPRKQSMTAPLPPNVVFGDKKRETVQATTVSEAGQASTEEQELLVRKLTFTSEAEKRRKNLNAAPDVPSFDLGFETQEETVDPAITKQEDSTKVEATMHGSIQG